MIWTICSPSNKMIGAAPILTDSACAALLNVEVVKKLALFELALDGSAECLNFFGANLPLPLIVIELSALQVGDNITLKSTRIFDGTEEQEGEIEDGETYSREYWLKKSSTASVELVEKLFPILQNLTTGVRPTYKKWFIGISVGNRAENFVYFNPKKSFVRVSAPQISNAAEWKERVERAGFKLLEGGEGVRFRVFPQQVEQHRELFVQLFEKAYKEWFE